MASSDKAEVAIIKRWESFQNHVNPMITQEPKPSFDQFATFMQNKATLKITMDFLKVVKAHCKLDKVPSPRILLVGHMLAVFPSEVMEINYEETKEDMDLLCLESAQKMVKALQTDPHPDLIVDAFKHINNFAEIFAKWKEMDLKRLLNNMSATHMQWRMSEEYLRASLSSSKNPTATQVCIDSVIANQKALEKEIEMIAGKAKVEEIRSRPIQFLDIDEIIKDVAAENYWKEFEKELSSVPEPKYQRVIVLLGEIRTRLTGLVPNREDIKSEIDSGIDVEFVDQMIRDKVFDGAQFFTIFMNIWSQIRNLQAPEDDQMWDEFKDKVFEDCENGKIWAELLPLIFNKFLVQLDRVEDSTRQFREQLKAAKN